MKKTSFFTRQSEFEKEFHRCSKEYDSLDMYIAWIGNPISVIPFEYLHNISSVNAVVGVAFCQTHPAGIKLLLELKVDLRIANEEVLYHPKVYIFSKRNKKAVFIGSSNFTFHGFYQNVECNVLLEGQASALEIKSLELDLRKWRTKEYSFKPDTMWLHTYTERYKKRRLKLKKAGLDDEAGNEEDKAITSAWLNNADWEVYLKKVKNGLRIQKETFSERLSYKVGFFDTISSELTLPWKVEYFKDIEKRRLIGGMAQWGWLGHVAASGNVRHILAKGTLKEQTTIVNSINAIARLSYPLAWNKLKIELNRLVALGPTMKVWGRLLALVRPDLFCTISSPLVRKNVAKLLGKAEKHFEEVDGYLMLLSLIHSSPWFTSSAPVNKNEMEIWKRRVAFLDVVLYV